MMSEASETKPIFQVVRSDYMDIPEEYICLNNYRASLGHKINHSFKPNCKWEVIEHPVFGRIPKIITLVDVPAEEELTCHYMIDMKEAERSERLRWYVEAWDKMN